MKLINNAFFTIQVANMCIHMRHWFNGSLADKIGGADSRNHLLWYAKEGLGWLVVNLFVVCEQTHDHLWWTSSLLLFVLVTLTSWAVVMLLPMSHVPNLFKCLINIYLIKLVRNVVSLMNSLSKKALLLSWSGWMANYM